jgi:putative transposase
VKTTYSGHSYVVRENLLRDFEVTTAGQVLVADITYIPLKLGHAYLFLITDAYSRMVVGYHLSQSLEHDGAIRALKSALKHIPNPKGVIHHSDRGVQYCCHGFLDEIRKWRFDPSMTDGDHCAQNALAECMNGILKREFLLGCEHPSFALAQRATDEAILNYNHFRIHGSLKGRTPAEVHHGYSRTIERWARELFSFQLHIPKMARETVNSI